MEIATAGGVTYEVNVPTRLSASLGDRSEAEIELLTRQVLTESSSAVYGFESRRERLLFSLLLTAQGVGARLALAMMSTMTPERLARALAEADYAALTQVPGIGRRTAEKISVSLKNKVGALATIVPGEESVDAGAGAGPTAVQALVGLGMDFAEADRRVQSALKQLAGGADGAGPGGADYAEPGIEELIKRALAATPAA